MKIYKIPYLSHENAALLKSLSGKTVDGIYYHHWKNVAKKNQEFSFILALELTFSDGSKLLLSSGSAEETPQIALNDIDIEQEKNDIIQRFSGQLVIESTDETASDLGQKMVGAPIKAVELEFDAKEQQYHADHLFMVFDGLMLLIRTGEEGDGLLIEQVVEHDEQEE